MRTRRGAAALAVTATLAALPLAAAPTAAATASGGYVKHADQTFLATGLGPAHDQTCPIAYDLYVPDSATPAHPAPAILTTNGFGGSKNDQAGLGAFGAGLGYVVLSYSGLGFGGSGCNIELDSPDWDGRAAADLVSFLATLPYVELDRPGDPRVGMVGGSYGGAVQLAAASVDPRIDTIVPIITWNDLGYSLGPNNDDPRMRQTDTPPGVLKWQWASLFFADGIATPLQHLSSTPTPPSTCPGFDPEICQAYASSLAAGYPTPQTIAMLRQDSMVTYGRSVHVPTMLVQGEADSLFTIEDAVANLRMLQANGVPTKLVLQSWGHSNSTPAPGEFSESSPSLDLYEVALIIRWFDHWLKRTGVSTGPAVEYFRDWVHYTGSAAPAYGQATSWPVGRPDVLHLSGDGTLQAGSAAVTAGTQTMVNPGGQDQPSSYSETSGVQDQAPFSSIPPSDPPGEAVTFTTGPLAGNVDVVGIPTATFTLSAPATSSADPATMPVLFGKLYDVAPDGTITLAQRLVAPLRVGSTAAPVTVTLPGIVHRFPAGDRLRLVLAATDQAYLGSRVPGPLSIVVDASHPGTLSLPVAGAPAASAPSSAAPAARVEGAAPATPAAATAPAAARQATVAARGATRATAVGARPAAARIPSGISPALALAPAAALAGLLPLGARRRGRRRRESSTRS